MFDVDLLSSVPTKSDKGCFKHGESYPCSYMPYYITALNNSLFDKLFNLNLMEKYLLYIFPCSVIIFCRH